MTFTHDKNLHTGIATSVGIHIVLLILLVTVIGRPTPTPTFVIPEKAKPKEPEVALLFPTQIIQPPPVKKDSKPFIRTSQNKAALVKPKNAAFQSDRNTFAASEKPPVPGSLHPMPTLDGNAPDIKELINRDYKEGEIKNDSAPSSVAAPKSPSAPPDQVAKATPTPLERIMAEVDKEQAKEGSRLPIEIRKAKDIPKTAAVEPPAPQVRDPADMPPPVTKAVPVDDPVKSNTPNPQKDSFSPFTRTAKKDGSVSQEGENAVNAEATPMGAYMRKVTGAVEKKWHLYVRLGKDAVTFGRVRFRFYVDAKGVPQDLEILSDAKDADPRMRDLTLRAILDAEIPPIPPELLETLDEERVKIEYEAIIY